MAAAIHIKAGHGIEKRHRMSISDPSREENNLEARPSGSTVVSPKQSKEKESNMNEPSQIHDSRSAKRMSTGTSDTSLSLYLDGYIDIVPSCCSQLGQEM